MSTFLYFLLALLLFGLIVFVHELGHFLAARAAGIGVQEFALGFGPKLLGWKGRTGTQYSLRVIPMGGFCSFYGEDGATSDREDAFARQKVSKRILTVVAGPFMNFALAYVAVVLFLTLVGYGQVTPRVAELTRGMGAQAAGMLPGDVVVEAMGEAIDYSEAGTVRLVALIQAADPEKPFDLVVRREGNDLPLSVALTRAQDTVQIGIIMALEDYRVPLGSALGQGAVGLVNATREMLNVLRNMFATGEGIEETAGPVGILSVMTEGVQRGPDVVLNMILVISLNLGIMNLLPLPALDGGRLVFLLIEAVRRKPVKPQYEGWVHAAGFVLFIGLFVVLTYRDIARLLGG